MEKPVLSATTPSQGSDELLHEVVLRPDNLSAFIGQDKIRNQLEVFIRAARNRHEPLDHVLLFGPPGLGKTTLAHIIAHEMGSSMQQTSGPALEKAGDLAAILSNLQPHDVLFIDEIHRLNPVIEETIYPAMEDFRLDIIIGEGPGARAIRLNLPPFTLVGATTRAGLLTSPLRDRFGIAHRLEFYGAIDMEQIVTRSAQILNIRTESEGIKAIASRSRGTPRIANKLLKRVRDYAEVESDGRITAEIADYALNKLEIDTCGLDQQDRVLLRTLIEKYHGGPVGIDSLAASIGEERSTIEDVIEPFLMQSGFLTRTQRGRIAEKKSYLHLGIQPAEQGTAQKKLF